MSQVGPEVYYAVIASISTAVLAVITFFYMRETRFTRKIAQNPSFSLEPTLYILGGTFHQLRLANTGQAANDICVDCSWGDSNKKFYVLSLSTQGRAMLYVPIAEIVEKKQKLSVKITCKDASGGSYTSNLIIDFGKASIEKRDLAYQYDPLVSIGDSLDQVERELSSINSDLRNLKLR